MSENVQVFAFGHSIVQGYWDEKGGYVQRLRTELDKRALEDPDNYYYEVFNLGISGEDSRQLLDRFRDELERRLWDEAEQVIMIHTGANDIQRFVEEDRIRVSRQDYKENLEELVEEALEYTGQVMLVSELYTSIEGPIPWAEEKALSDERLGEYVEIQREVADKKGVLLVDLRDLKGKDEWLEMLEDGSHPDNQGHEVIKEEVMRKMREEGFIE